jgi:hypothetical protein
MCTYDVFDEAGHFFKQVEVGCKGDGVKDGLFFVGQDRALVVTGFLDAVLSQMGGGDAEEEEEVETATPTEIICYKIP